MTGNANRTYGFGPDLLRGRTPVDTPRLFDLGVGTITPPPGQVTEVRWGPFVVRHDPALPPFAFRFGPPQHPL